MTGNRYLNGYIQGLADAAAIASDNLTFSGINTFCFDKDSFTEDYARLRRECGAGDSNVELITGDLTPEQELSDLLDSEDRSFSSNIMWSLSRAAGRPERVLRFEDEPEEKEAASGYSYGWGGFYFVEDMFFIEFEEYVILFVVGNDE